MREATRIRAATLLLALAIAALAGGHLLTTMSPVRAQSLTPGIPWSCSLDDVGATLTKCVVSKGSMPYDSLTQERLYITDLVAQSTTATVGQFILRYGTGTNCGTGTTSLFPAAATVVRFAYPPNTAAPLVIQFANPLIVPASVSAATGAEHPHLCALGIATQTLSLHVGGYVGQ